jgi:hypothetical protein
MRVSDIDFTKPVELDFIAADVPSDLFIEERWTSKPSRRGWAPPRKRPRRVHKKLKARGFAAHHGGPVHGDRLREVVHERAPTIQREAHSFALRDLVFRAPDYRFNGSTWEKAPKEMVERSAWNGGRYVERRFKLTPIRLLCPVDDETVLRQEYEDTEWRAQDWFFEAKIYQRKVFALVKVHTPLPVSEPDARFIERRGGQLMAALARAASPFERTFNGRVLARQTNYRPKQGQR